MCIHLLSHLGEEFSKPCLSVTSYLTKSQHTDTVVTDAESCGRKCRCNSTIFIDIPNRAGRLSVKCRSKPISWWCRCGRTWWVLKPVSVSDTQTPRHTHTNTDRESLFPQKWRQSCVSSSCSPLVANTTQMTRETSSHCHVQLRLVTLWILWICSYNRWRKCDSTWHFLKICPPPSSLSQDRPFLRTEGNSPSHHRGDASLLLNPVSVVRWRSWPCSVSPVWFWLWTCSVCPLRLQARRCPVRSWDPHPPHLPQVRQTSGEITYLILAGTDYMITG